VTAIVFPGDAQGAYIDEFDGRIQPSGGPGIRERGTGKFSVAGLLSCVGRWIGDESMVARVLACIAAFTAIFRRV
jgi:hypothetical protein